MRSFPGILIVCAALILLAVGVLTQLETAEERPPPQPERQVAYSDRVQQRLDQLRADYERQRAQQGAEPRPAPAKEAQPQGVFAPRPLPVRSGAQRGAPPVLPPAVPPVDEIPWGPQFIEGLNALTKPLPGFEEPQYQQRIADLEYTVRQDPDPAHRLAALEELGTAEERDAFPILIAALEDADAEVRLTALEGLADYPDYVGADAILPALGDRDAEIRFEAVNILGTIEGQDALDALYGMLGDPDQDVRDLARGIIDLRAEMHG